MSDAAASTTRVSEFTSSLGAIVRDNPLSAALVGMGVAWLLTGGKPIATLGALARRTGVDRLPDQASETLRAGRDAVATQIADKSEALSNGAAMARDAASAVARAPTQALSRLDGQFWSDTRSRLADLLEEQPLLLGAIGVGIGASVAAALPLTDFEAEALGETGASLRTNAEQFASEQAKRAGTMVDTFVDTVSNEARAQGLTSDDAIASVGKAKAKLKSVAEAGVDSVVSRLR